MYLKQFNNIWKMASREKDTNKRQTQTNKYIYKQADNQAPNSVKLIIDPAASQNDKNPSKSKNKVNYFKRQYPIDLNNVR